MSDFYERSTIVHQHLRGKIGIVNKMPIESQDDLSIAYTPGVAGPCLKIAENGALAREPQATMFRLVRPNFLLQIQHDSSSVAAPAQVLQQSS